ncbi:MAG TPA: tetratricopeptide repeat protein [Polyangiales bacterium]
MLTISSSRTLCLLWMLASLQACARKAETTTPTKVVEMDPLRIVAKHDQSGAYSFESYDAEELFKRGNAELDAGRCPEAVAFYDRVASEFVGNRFVSPSLYNAGLCLAQTGLKEQALKHFETLIDTLPDSPDVKHASFQAGHLQIALTRWEPAEQTASKLLARNDLEAGERVEAMSMQAEALLGRDQLDAAEHAAQQTLTYYRTRPIDQITDPFYAATANFVYAEVIRLRGERMAFPDTNQEEQKAILVRRAQLLLDAQREYFNTIRHTDAHWAAAAGHRIGGMYDKLWHDLVHAPVPASLSPGAKELYPQEMAKLIKPLLRHAIRYWELTLLMVERTGVQTDWAEQTKRDLERVRALLLEQPAGPGGLPPQPVPAASTPNPAAPDAAPPTAASPAIVAPQ